MLVIVFGLYVKLLELYSVNVVIVFVNKSLEPSITKILLFDGETTDSTIYILFNLDLFTYIIFYGHKLCKNFSSRNTK